MVAYTNYLRDPRVRREAEALVQHGHRVTFLASRQRGEGARDKVQGVEVRKLPGIAHSKVSAAGYIVDYALFFVMCFMHMLLRPLRYDLVHINNMPDFLALSATVPRLLGKPVIHDVHDLMPELYQEKFGTGEDSLLVRFLKLQEWLAGRFASAVITVEERLRVILDGRGIPREKIDVLMNLPDDRIFAPRGSMPRKLPGERFVVVYHGTLARRLGLDVALRAVARIRNEVPSIELRIIGAGEERATLIALRDELGLQGLVTFSDGFVPVERIPEMIKDADVGLIPLRISGGTDIMLPTKLLEYVTMGIPCITPRTGTICRYFDEQMVQFFVAEDVASLADAIVGLYRDPERRERLAQQATARFGRAYTWSRHKEVYIRLVDRLLET